MGFKQKIKPISHKNQNTFKFLSFAERLSNINVQVIHKLQKPSEVPEERDTFFNECLEKWNELNLTDDYISLKRDFGSNIQTLTQLILQKDDVINALKTVLSNAENHALDAAFELLVAVARDLQADFYSNYPEFFMIFLELLKNKNTELIEQTFTCMSYLFKFLWRYMITDITDICKLYLPLLKGNQKHYIRKFSAESISFLIRKVKDKQHLFSFILESADSDPELVDGTGMLLFEAIKGINKKFHSCHENVISLLLTMLVTKDCSYSTETIYSVLLQMFNLMVKYSEKTEFSGVWSCFGRAISSFENSTEPNFHFKYLIKLIKVCINHKYCILITNLDSITEMTEHLLSLEFSDESIYEDILSITSCILNSSNIKLEMEKISRLTNKIFCCKCAYLTLFDFIRDMFSYGMFSKDFLPPLLDYCDKMLNNANNSIQEDILSVITELIQFNAPEEDIHSMIFTQEVYPLNFKSDHSKSRANKGLKFSKYLFQNLKLECSNTNFGLIWSSALCLVHLRSIDQELVCSTLKNAFGDAIEKLLKPKSCTNHSEIAFVSEQILKSFILAADEKNALGLISPKQIIQLLCKYPDDIHVLKLVFYCYSLFKQENFKSIDKGEIYKMLESNMSSPLHLVRLYSLKILNLFSYKLPPVEDKVLENSSVFDICFNAEIIPLTVQDSRERQKFLQRLDFDTVQSYIPSELYSQVPLHYLLGSLFVNFQPLWHPIQQLITNHAVNMDSKVFWQIFYHHLIKITEFSCITDQKSVPTPMDPDNLSSLDQYFHLCFKNFLSESEKIDYHNHRYLLWDAMSMFPEIVEPHNREISTLFLDFIQKEFYVTDLMSAPSQNLLRDRDTYDESKPLKTKTKPSTKILCCHLKLFSKLKNPKAIHRENELKDLYYDFLKHKNNDVQKLSLDCIMTYKFKYLSPYSENLYFLLDDKTFKSEIVHFTIDSENSIIDAAHREGLFPVLLRILYGKMLHKTGSNTSGKANAAIRRAIVLRYLAGTQNQELKMFLDMVFSIFIKHLKGDDAMANVLDIKNSLDVKKIIPLYRLQSNLNMLGLIFDKLGSLIEQFIPFFLNILLAVMTIISNLLSDHQSIISTPCLNMIRNLRTNAMNCIIQFFENYEQYSFNSSEIDAIFEAVVYPQLKTLENDCVSNPSPLLRLFKTWSSIPKYFVLFSKVVPENGSSGVLLNACRLFSTEHIYAPVTDLILVILENLFTFQDVDEGTVIPVNNVTINFEYSETINFGTRLLLPHVHLILKKMKLIVRKSNNNSKIKLTPQHLTILSRVSEHVTSKGDSLDTINLLLSCLKKSVVKSEDAQVNSLKTIGNLLKNVDQPSRFTRSISSLFSIIRDRLARSALCDCLAIIASNDESVQRLSLITSMLNAWDPKKMEEPDYGQRLDGFKMVRELLPEILKTNHLIPFGLVVIHNCCFFIAHTDDMSLRDAASFTLQTILSSFGSLYKDNVTAFNAMVLETIIPDIRKHLRSRNENVRHEYITVLAKIIDVCSDYPKFEELAQLRNQDHEVDFFENIKHIQVHRRARALVRFAHSLKKNEMKFSSEILSSYIMPIASSFLTGSYEKHNNLVDAAIMVIGAICRYLPWYRYDSILQYYMKLVPKVSDRQKTIIKIIVSILNSFHFDLSKSEGINSKIWQNAKKKNPKNDEKNNDDDKKHQESDNDEEPIFDEDTAQSSENVETIDVELATKIHKIVASSTIPHLSKILNQKAKSDNEHKSNKKKYPEDEEILRIPIAIAMVKLLQNLPSGMLENSLPGILLRLCELLRSRSESIRDTTRQTLAKVMTILGSKYVWYMLQEMKGTMKRGYQVHVMTYSIHTVLLQMSESKLLKCGDLDNCLRMLTDICNDELFGNMSEEKEVVQITRKWKEARGVKSYNLYFMMSKYISSSFLPNLLINLKNVLSSTHSHKLVLKIVECLHQITLGLTANEVIDIKTLMIFIHGICNESIPMLSDRPSKPSVTTCDSRLQPTDTYIIPLEPKKVRLNHKKSGPKTNSHILIEFGLQLLNSLLRKNKLTKSCQEHVEMLDPFVDQLSDCLLSQHVKSISAALRCLIILLQFPLPSLEKTVNDITKSIFVILHKYAGPGLAQGDNFEMVILCFKTVTILIRYVSKCEIDEDKIKVLLTYIEQDIHDSTRQATAFSLMKALLSRKVYNEEIVELMRKIMELSVTSEMEHIRAQCRQVILQYILDYPLGKKLTLILQFLVRQISYAYEPGRESILELFNSMFSAFPQNVLTQHSGLFLISLATGLMNDESSKCRKMISLVIKKLLEKLSAKVRNDHFNMIEIWFEDKKGIKKRLAAQLCGLFAEVEQDQFVGHLDVVFKHAIKETVVSVSDETDDENISDKLLYHILNMLIKAFNASQVLKSNKHQESVTELFGNLQKLILYPHAWIRLMVVQLFGLLFSVHSVDKVIDAAISPSISSVYLFSNTRQKLRDLTADFCTILQSPLLNDELSEQVVRNLVYLGKVIHRLDSHGVLNGHKEDTDQSEDHSEESGQIALSFDWIIRRLLREVRQEVMKNPKDQIKRSSIFKWIAAVSVDLGAENLPDKLWLLLRPLVRELTDASAHADETLRKLAQEVLDVMKGIVGVDIFTRKYTEVQSKIGEKRVQRKRDRAADALTNPALAAERKMKKHMAKRVAKKRKIQEYKGNLPSKARKIKDSS